MSRRSIRFDFIKEELWKKLPKSIETQLRSYKGYYGNYVKEENKIKELEIEIENHKGKMEKYRKEMFKRNKELDYLRNQFTFWVSLIKTNPKKYFEYYIITISRYHHTPKNIYLGSEKKVTARLKEFYKRDKDRLKKIDKDWYMELNSDCIQGIVWDRVMDLIIGLGDKFQHTTINLDTMYPIKKKK